MKGFHALEAGSFSNFHSTRTLFSYSNTEETQENTCINDWKNNIPQEKEMLDRPKAPKQGTSKGALHIAGGLMSIYLMV